MAANSVIRVTVVAEDRMTQTLDRTAKATEGISQKLSNMGKAVAAAVAVRALGAVKEFVDDSVRAFSDLEQSIGGTEAVSGSSRRSSTSTPEAPPSRWASPKRSSAPPPPRSADS